jgi:hypothetical protein
VVCRRLPPALAGASRSPSLVEMLTGILHVAIQTTDEARRLEHGREP